MKISDDRDAEDPKVAATRAELLRQLAALDATSDESSTEPGPTGESSTEPPTPDRNPEAPSGYHGVRKGDGAGVGRNDDVETSSIATSEVSSEDSWADLNDMEKAQRRAEKKLRQKERKRAEAAARATGELPADGEEGGKKKLRA